MTFEDVLQIQILTVSGVAELHWFFWWAGEFSLWLHDIRRHILYLRLVWKIDAAGWTGQNSMWPEVCGRLDVKCWTCCRETGETFLYETGRELPPKNTIVLNIIVPFIRNNRSRPGRTEPHRQERPQTFSLDAIKSSKGNVELWIIINVINKETSLPSWGSDEHKAFILCEKKSNRTLKQWTRLSKPCKQNPETWREITTKNRLSVKKRRRSRTCRRCRNVVE